MFSFLKIIMVVGKHPTNQIKLEGYGSQIYWSQTSIIQISISLLD